VAATERTPPSGRRSRGRKAGLSLARIVEAARSLDAGTLTMQAVADTLGVDRKAINHHVTDRETLLRLVALEALSDSSSAVDIPADSTWQEACRTFATAITENAIAADALADHLRSDNSMLRRFVEPTDTLLRKMTEAGFDDESAVRSLALLTNICVAYARDVVHAARGGERPRRLLIHEALDGRDDREFESLTRILAAGVDTYDRKQLDMSIEVFLRGTEAVLRRHHETAGPARR